MPFIKKIVLPILVATLWISLSEFVRNEWLLQSYWFNHYNNMGLQFPAEPLNGAIWGLWSICLAIGIYLIAKKFSLWATTVIAWLMAFVLMWLVTGNLGVLPFPILLFAVPLSILEVLLAVLIIKKLSL